VADQLLEHRLGLFKFVLAETAFISDEVCNSLGVLTSNYRVIQKLSISILIGVFEVELNQFDVVGERIQGHLFALSNRNEVVFAAGSLVGGKSL